MKTEYINIAPASLDCIHVVQITDTHVFASNGREFKGMDTSMSLQQVIAAIHRDSEKPDLILATGDLAHDPVPEAYEGFRHIVHTTDIPVFCLPGNHDRPAMMDELLNADKISTCKSIRCGAWEFILLDSVIEGDEKGFLQADELTFLRSRLLHSPAEYVAICLHHQPVEIGSPWMDEMKVVNGEELLRLVQGFPRARCILWGHIHQEFTSQLEHVLLLGSPSTCIQFKPGTQDFEIDVLPPAYRKFKFFHDGQIDTTLHWLDPSVEPNNIR